MDEQEDVCIIWIERQMVGYVNRLCSINRKEAETEIDLGKARKNISCRNRLVYLHNEVKKKSETH
jgi:hypothetical protein